MMGSATWFEGVDVTEPSMVYTFSWSKNKLSKRRYWSWSSITRSSLSLDDAAEQLGELLDNAIKARYFGKGSIGVGLSGGFDSRAILAAIREYDPVTYTFGRKSSPDVRIAGQVARIARVKNIHFEMEVENWLERRFDGVWKTDGMLNMYHMHYSHVLSEISKLMDINLSGFLADGVLGSTYLTKKHRTFMDKRMDRDTAMHYYGKYFEYSNPLDSFFDLDKVDVYLFYNRGRRLTGLGMEEANKTVYQRMPFMDIKLLDFSYSLPDEYRIKSQTYHRALVRRYPEFYETIPHATSGVSIQLNPSLQHTLKKSYHEYLRAFKVKLGIPTSFTDVHNWVKKPETAAFISSILDPKHSLYREFTDKDFVKLYVEPQLSGKSNYIKQMMGALTIEVWLQQLFKNRYLKNTP
jgi:asparagine synthase (glutamine-hydrolysing)